jgi:hypothetical protein
VTAIAQVGGCRLSPLAFSTLALWTTLPWVSTEEASWPRRQAHTAGDKLPERDIDWRETHDYVTDSEWCGKWTVRMF